jgi:hypothetical protein
MDFARAWVMLCCMKKLTHKLLPTILAFGLSVWAGQLAAQAQSDTGASGGNNDTAKHNVNNTGGAGVNGKGNATSGGATSSTSGGDANGGSNGAGSTSSGDTTHVNTAAGITPGDGNRGVRSTPPSGVTPGTGASPNPH